MKHFLRLLGTILFMVGMTFYVENPGFTLANFLSFSATLLGLDILIKQGGL